MDERELVIKRGEEFKISVKDKIENTDLFYDQYISAAKMLNDIVSYSDKDKPEWEDSEFENNIIAFCGERGEGKSSAMISFTKAVYEHENYPDVSIFEGLDHVRNAYFAEPIVIDPSMLDDVHNVLDIILAKLYKKFRDQYDKDNQSIEGYKREKLLDQFQKVYQCISLINNQTKMLDDEYDYEGNIGKLSKLGQSTDLKKKLQELIQTYIEIMSDSNKKDRKSGWLPVAIDDLDLCNSYAYKVAEQIRKYLVIPNVVIVMALKVEQLQLCVRENNHKDYERMLRVPQEISELRTEIINMSERYVAKLIPKIRRIYLPNVHMMQNVKLVYKERDEKEKDSQKGDGKGEPNTDQKVDKMEKADTESVSSVDKSLLDLIYRKTGMRFLPDKTGKNYFLPDNLRDTVNIVALLMDMKEPGGENQEDKNQIYYENIQIFFNYYERQWLFSNVSPNEYKEMQGLIHAKAQFHENSVFLLQKRYKAAKKKRPEDLPQFFGTLDDSFYQVMGWLKEYRNNAFGEELKKYAYVFQVLYTIRMNELLRNEKYDELIEFMGGYLWGEYFQNVLPSVKDMAIDRSRFALSTVHVFNIIAQELYPNKAISLPEPQDEQYYVKEITGNDATKNEKILIWVILGMICNASDQNMFLPNFYKVNSKRLISTNHSLARQICVSIENYMVSLCNLNSIYDKVNMEYLGIDKKEFDAVVKNIEESNENVIEICRRIAVNTDAAMELIEYCNSKRKDIKEGGTKSELIRSQTAVDIFFNNVSDFAVEYMQKHSDSMGSLKLAYDEGREIIQISRIYARLIETAAQEREPDVLASRDEKRREEMIMAFTAKLNNRVEKIPALERVSKYFVVKTAKNAEANMSSLASNIQRYYSLHREENMNRGDVLALCDLYRKILDVYWENPQEEISNEVNNIYKKLRNRFDKVCH